MCSILLCYGRCVLRRLEYLRCRSLIHPYGGWRVATLLAALCAAMLTAAPARAQDNEWTWMGGSDANATAPGVYGTLGIPAPGNFPGAHQYSASWTDASGDLWMFGGLASDANNSGPAYMNDLWKYDPDTNQWAWIGGSSTVKAPGTPGGCLVAICGVPGVYGTQGTAAAGNVPGGRMGAASWTDSQGNVWIFGGFGFDSAGTLVYLNDLWKYNPSTNQWTWMGGPSTVTGVCFGDGNPLDGTYCGGEPGVYGTQGVEAATNIPGGRAEPITWVDKSGNFWLMGGYHIDSAVEAQYVFDDLWRFNPSTGEWAWMGGAAGPTNPACVSDPNSNVIFICGELGVYGTRGAASASNMPGSRLSGMGWTDAAGNLWLMGGSAWDSGAGGFNPLNDVWSYNMASGEWTWMGGSDAAPGCMANFSDTCGGVTIPPIDGSDGNLGQAAPANIPELTSASAYWKDASGNFWIFSGSSMPVIPLHNEFSWGANGFWKFEPAKNLWTWMGGSPASIFPVVSVYGTLGQAAAGNVPGSRFGAASWTGKDGRLWLLGGYGTTTSSFGNYLNDLWVYQPSTAPLPTTATPTLSVPEGSYSSAQSVTLDDATDGATIYYTTDGTTPTTNSAIFSAPGFLPGAEHPISVPYSATIKTMAIASGCYPSAVATATYTLSTSVATPTFSLPSGTYDSAQNVVISDASSGVTIYYTTDGSTPTTNSPAYRPSGNTWIPLPVVMTETLKAIAVANGYSSNSAGASAVATATYTLNLPPAPVPTFSIPAGTYTSAQTVVIHDSAPNALIYYTTDGSTPTFSLPPFIDGVPVSVSSSETLKAFAIGTGYNPSAVSSAAYTINLPPPSFALSADPISTAVSPGGSSPTTLTVTSQNGFNSTVSFACSGLPARVTCAFSPTTVTPPSGGQAITQLTIAESSSASIAPPSGRTFLPYAALAMAFGFIGIGWRRRRFNRLQLFLIAALPLIAAISACGGGSSPRPSTPENATVKVTATSGSLQQTATIALTVN